jgi:alkyl sulfatase BDS1-like metallo-beta-lactamase superfamily hydrolase
MDRSTLDDIALGKLKLSELANSGKVALTGDRAKFNEFVACFEHFNFWFTISEP